MTASFSTPIMIANKFDYYLLKESRGKSFNQSREPFYQFKSEDIAYTANNIGQIRLVKTRHDTWYWGNDLIRIILYLNV